MEIKVFDDSKLIGEAAASIYSAQISANPYCVLGFATGSTPIPTYQALIKLYKEKKIDFSKVTTFNLDEYCGLSPTHMQSYYYFMMENLFNHINIPLKNINMLSGVEKDTDAECGRLETKISACGGINLQLLGIGPNGHIAFNEPANAFTENTHVAELTKETIDANKRFFTSADDVPRYALTMGIGTIMKAKKIIIIATGKHKAQAVYSMIKEPVTPLCPASILQKHQNVTVLLDQPAASLL